MNFKRGKDYDHYSFHMTITPYDHYSLHNRRWAGLRTLSLLSSTLKLCTVLPILTTLWLFDTALGVPSVAEHSTTVVTGAFIHSGLHLLSKLEMEDIHIDYLGST